MIDRLCVFCLNKTSEISDGCNDKYSKNNTHFTMRCHSRTRNIFTAQCGHKFHRCCLYSYTWLMTGCDVEGETGTISCPLCRKKIEVTID